MKRSRAPNSEVFLICVPLPGVGGGRLTREGEEAIEEVEVAGEGGFVSWILESTLVTTLGGNLILVERLFLRVCVGSDNA